MPFDATPVDPQLARLRQLADELDRVDTARGTWSYAVWDRCAINVALEAKLMARPEGRLLSAGNLYPLAAQAFGLDIFEFARIFGGGVAAKHQKCLGDVTPAEVAAEVRALVRARELA